MASKLKFYLVHASLKGSGKSLRWISHFKLSKLSPINEHNNELTNSRYRLFKPSEGFKSF